MVCQPSPLLFLYTRRCMSADYLELECAGMKEIEVVHLKIKKKSLSVPWLRGLLSLGF